MVTVENIEVGKKVKESLEGRTQRWLVLKLIESGIDMTDVKLSNKIQGISTFTSEELEKINKILGTSL